MVLGILVAIAACPAIIGTTEVVRQGQRQNTSKKRHRGLKTKLFVNCSATSRAGREVDGCEAVLSDNKVRCSSKVLASGQPILKRDGR